MIRETWTEADIRATPEEHDSYERKSGTLLDDAHEFQKELAVQLSAMANSGGGHIILGQADDGAFNGVASTKGKTRTKEWIEQIIPNLTQYPLPRFRVHEVAIEGLAADRCVVVVDVPDSHRAPHQAYFKGMTPQYYMRSGAHSVPAPHHFLDALHNRVTRIVLVPALVHIRINTAFNLNGSVVADFVSRWDVKNESRQIANTWAVLSEVIQPKTNFEVLTSKDVGNLGPMGDVKTGQHILPSQSQPCTTAFGLVLRNRPGESLLKMLTDFWGSATVAGIGVSENLVGDEQEYAFREGFEGDLLQQMRDVLKRERLEISF